MPNQRSQNLTYIDARQAFLLGVDPDQDSRLKNCNWDRDLVARFACAYYFPPCSENGTVLPPCRSLCTGYDFILPLTFCMQCFMYAIHHNIRHEWLQECFIYMSKSYRQNCHHGCRSKAKIKAISDQRYTSTTVYQTAQFQTRMI